MLDPQLEKILYFPSNGVIFQPEPDEHPLAFNQIEKIRSDAQFASRRFHGNQELVTKHIYNKLRITFCAQRIEDIPRQHFEHALDLIEQAREEVLNFNTFIKELEKLFAEKILRGNDPWTPNIKTKWCKRLVRTLPERPDWQALANEIERTSRGK